MQESSRARDALLRFYDAFSAEKAVGWGAATPSH